MLKLWLLSVVTLVFPAAFHRDCVIAHQSAYAAMADIEPKLLQLFGHAWATIAAKG